jgi:UDP-GlcNAc:undecaprenyl-phosphate/decaprenyl-phosphate GlcNAc-1-phosphate transferase
MTGFLPAYVVAFGLAVLLVPVVSIVARRSGAMATPRSDRWNVRPVPILGGLAIAGGILAGSLLLGSDTIDLVALLGAMAVMLVLGLVDDLASVGPWRRLFLEGLTAAAFTWLVTSQLDVPIRIAAIVVATACVPVAINAVNLVDNADGLASLLSIVTAATLAAIVATVGIPSQGGSIALVIAAACLGFLVHNRPPARVFMGDSGSLMLGFGLAGCSVLIVRDAVFLPGASHAAAAMAVPLAWAVQFGDLGMVFITRLRRRASPFRGDVDHTSHRLISAGIGPVGMLVALSAVGAAVGAAAVWLSAWAGDFRLVAVAATALAALVAALEAVIAWRLPYGHNRPLSPDERPTAHGDAEIVAIPSGTSVGRRSP